jgi:hypothetical protein
MVADQETLDEEGPQDVETEEDCQVRPRMGVSKTTKAFGQEPTTMRRSRPHGTTLHRLRCGRVFGSLCAN